MDVDTLLDLQRAARIERTVKTVHDLLTISVEAAQATIDNRKYANEKHSCNYLGTALEKHEVAIDNLERMIAKEGG